MRTPATRLPDAHAWRRPRAAGLALALSVLALGLARADTPAASLYVDCRGPRTSAPTVILQSGLFGTSADWELVLQDLSKDGRVCAYDRAGLGRSPPRAGGEDVTAIAAELDGLLGVLGETRPVILVGHSNGALYAEAFAALWPKKVAGLVYINGVNSTDLDYPVLVKDLERERALADLAVTGAKLGLGPLIAHALASGAGLSGAAAAHKQAALGQIEQLRVGRDEDAAMIPGLATVRDLGGSPPGIPTVVIVGAPDPHTTLAKAWRAAGQALTQRARISWMLDADGATHTSPLVRDRAYVAAAVGWLRSWPSKTRSETEKP
jgi:pimeloyl-ACP methyl ester carboxylesterase